MITKNAYRFPDEYSHRVSAERYGFNRKKRSFIDFLIQKPMGFVGKSQGMRYQRGPFNLSTGTIPDILNGPRGSK